MKRLLLKAATFLALSCLGWAQAKTTNTQTRTAGTQAKAAPKCPTVTPKNAQEAVMMEQSTNKNGCWERSKNTGQLVFVSAAPPDQYKPLLADPSPTTRSNLTITIEGGKEKWPFSLYHGGSDYSQIGSAEVRQGEPAQFNVPIGETWIILIRPGRSTCMGMGTIVPPAKTSKVVVSIGTLSVSSNDSRPDNQYSWHIKATDVKSPYFTGKLNPEDCKDYIARGFDARRELTDWDLVPGTYILTVAPNFSPGPEQKFPFTIKAGQGTKVTF